LKYLCLFILVLLQAIQIAVAGTNQKNFTESAYDAANTYHFQIPFFAGLASLLLLDGEVSDNASKNTPLFGSQSNAKAATDGMLLALFPVMMYTSTLPALRDQTESEYFSPRTKFLLTQSSIILIDFLTIHAIKSSTRRIRPDQSDNLSFPSGHSSLSSGLARTIYNNIKNSPKNDTKLGKTIQYGSFITAGLVAWGRVEAKKHHLSDVLLGNAFGAYISDLLYSIYYKHYNVQPIVEIENADEVSLNLIYRF